MIHFAGTVLDFSNPARLVASTSKFAFGLVLLISLVTPLTPRGVLVNEVMSLNASVVSDEDGDYPDWIELFNTEASPVDLGGYWLTDDEADTFKWRFPDLTIPPTGHVLIFASGKDREGQVFYWENLVDWGDTWKYRLGDSEPPPHWTTLDFDDSGWLTGRSGFGYGDGDDSTVVSQTISLYARILFTVENVSNVAEAVLHVDYDDSFVAYLNGMEVARANIGSAGIPPAFDQTASSLREATVYQRGRPERFELGDIQIRLNDGANILAIQVHNADITSPDLTLIPFLTFLLREAPDSPSSPPRILNLPPSSIHTNFRIRAEGEALLLSSPDGDRLDFLYTDHIPADVSRGRLPDGGPSWVLFTDPTPGSSNASFGYESVAGEPVVSLPGGFYSGTVSLTLSSDSPSSTIHYTLNASEPEKSSEVYSAPINITASTVVRSRAFEAGHLPSKTVTHTYFIDESSSLPVFSLSTDPENLWDAEYGIYTLGSHTNYFQDWERPVHVEFYEPGGEPGFGMDAGVKIFGGDVTRHFPQKSLSIFARGIYGYPEVDYPLFPNLPITVFEAFVLRNSGNDWEGTLFQDALITGLMRETGLDIQAYRPSVVYINGQYWGIHNIREKINEHFLAAHHGVDPNNIDLLENKEMPESLVLQGDAVHYDQLIEFVTKHNLKDQDSYAHVKTLMDVDNFITYQVSQIYSANMDWPANNVKYWRPRTPDGRWRWILYDTDAGFGFWDYQENGHTRNHLAHATEPDGPEEWPDPPWSTLLFRRLLENESFRNDFINQFANHLNTTFQPARVLQRIERLSKAIESEIPRHFSRWDRNVSEWRDQIERLKTFASRRPRFVRLHIRTHFDLTGTFELTLGVTPPGAGIIELNSMEIKNFPLEGVYFKDIPIRLRASPSPEYRFVGWLGTRSPNDSTVTLNLRTNSSVTAVFERIRSEVQTVVINEINFNSSNDFDTEDWIEFHNPTDRVIDISGWIFKDSDDDHTFIFPEKTSISPSGYLVLCRDSPAFLRHFPEVSNYVGDLNFGLSSNGELVRLYNDKLDLLDSLTYGVEFPWPTEPNGTGSTLALINASADNSLARNWDPSENHGTPGTENSARSPVAERGYRLYQNFPNPFNVNTIIEYDIPVPQNVTLNIFDIQGRVVETLLGQEMPQGHHLVLFNRPGLSSGVYVYQLVAGKFSKTRKMVYIK